MYNQRAQFWNLNLLEDDNDIPPHPPAPIDNLDLWKSAIFTEADAGPSTSVSASASAPVSAASAFDPAWLRSEPDLSFLNPNPLSSSAAPFAWSPAGSSDINFGLSPLLQPAAAPALPIYTNALSVSTVPFTPSTEHTLPPTAIEPPAAKRPRLSRSATTSAPQSPISEDARSPSVAAGDDRYLDKRRRNTEASARFRAKKKERGQQLESAIAPFHAHSPLTVYLGARRTS